MMQSFLKLSLPFNQKCIKIDFKNLQEPNWNEVTDVYKFRIDVKEDDIYQCREIPSMILYLVDTTTNFVIYNHVVIDKTLFFFSFSKSKEISHAYNIECFGRLSASF